MQIIFRENKICPTFEINPSYFYKSLILKPTGKESHSVEKREIYSHQKIFREINFLVTSLVKPLVSRNFCQKSMIVNFHNFPHCGPITN